MKYDNASLVQIPSGYKASTLYSVLPQNGNGDFDFTRGSTATRVNENGLIESVGSNVPRLDYPLLNGVVQSCPSLLLEPSRTNLVLYSEDLGSVSWTTYNANLSTNQSTAPDGNVSADLLTEDSTLNSHRISYTTQISVTSGQTYTFSFFVKNNGTDVISISAGNFGELQINSTFNLVNGTSTSAAGTATINKIGDYYYCTATGAATTTRLQSILIYLNRNNVSYPFSYQGDGISGAYIWGVQAEQGNYATSYIKTEGLTQTRSADVCNGAGTSAEFNDSEGVLFAETSFSDRTTAKAISISDGSFSNRALIYLSTGGTLANYTFVGGVNQCNIGISNYDYSTNSKIALKYKLNDCSVWINGFEMGVDTSAAIFPEGTLNEMAFDANGAGSDPFYGKTKQLATFNVALSDTQLEDLTSWDNFAEMAQSQLYITE